LLLCMLNNNNNEKGIVLCVHVYAPKRMYNYSMHWNLNHHLPLYTFTYIRIQNKAFILLPSLYLSLTCAPYWFNILFFDTIHEDCVNILFHLYKCHQPPIIVHFFLCTLWYLIIDTNKSMTCAAISCNDLWLDLCSNR